MADLAGNARDVACTRYVPSIVNDYGSLCENCMCIPEEHEPSPAGRPVAHTEKGERR